jgi:L-threonylcarbamoyladenylate synthase
MSSVISVATGTPAETIADAVARAVECLQSGGLAVIPTDTSYAIIADAFHTQALDKLRTAKEYLGNVPLPIAAASIETIRGVANLSPLASDLAHAFWPGALTILTRSQYSLSWNVGSADSALAVRVPNHEVAQAVLSGIGPTVMTGSQRAGGSAVLDIEQAVAALGDAVDVYLDDGTLSATQSAVVDCTGEHIRLVRAGALTLADLRNIMPLVIDATASN